MKRIHRETIRLTLTAIIIAGACALAPSGCKNANVSDTAITTGVSVTTAAALKMSIKDPTKRTQIADYIEGSYANAIRSITGNPTPNNFIEQLNSFIPLSVQQEYPELITFVNPIALWAYQQAYEKFNGDVGKISQYLNDVATGMQNGAAQYATRH